MESVKAAGWRILVKPRDPADKIGSVYLAGQSIDQMKTASIVCQVVSVGPLAYQDDKFGGQPWVKEGDWILIGKYSGMRFKIGGVEHRIMNDDEVLALVDEPDKVQPF